MALNKIDKKMIDDSFVQDVENVKNTASDLTTKLAETVKKDEGGIITPAMLSQATKEQMTGGSVAVVGVNSVLKDNIVNGAVTPEKISVMQKSKNLFNGAYSRMALIFNGSPATMKYRGLLANEVQKTAIIPIQADKTYTVKVHELAKKDVFKLAIVNSLPDLSNVNWQTADVTLLNNDTLHEFSFKNTSAGKFLLVYVSSVGLEPKLQVEEGVRATEYVEHLLFPDTHTQTKSQTSFVKSKNIFSGEYYKLTLEPLGTPMKIVYRGLLPTEKQRTAIVPLESGKTYTVTVADTINDRFRIAVVNEFPDILNINNKDADTTILSDDAKKTHTFTNSELGKFALIHVSSTGAEPKLQVEEGTKSTPYKNHLVIPSESTETDGAGESIINNITNNTINSAAKAPREAIIIGAQEDETPTVSGATLSYDTKNFKVGSRGYKLSIPSATTASLMVNPIVTPAKVNGIGVVGLWVFIPDATKVLSLWVDIYSNVEKTVAWSVKSIDNQSLVLGGIKNGWNYVRWTAAHSNNTENNLNGWGTIYSTRIMVVTNGATEVTIGKLVGEISQKAQILFVEDAQYRSFYDIAYQDLKARNIPVTWALRISTIGNNVGLVNEQLTEQEIEVLSKENNNSISFHSYDGQNSTMTPLELRIETMKAIKWLSGRGYTGWHWRAAFLQNSAPSHTSIRDLVTAYSMPSGGQYVLGAFPFLNPYNTPRMGIHGETKENITAIFEKLKKTHQLFICYTHGVADGVSGDVTPEIWNHFISEVDKGIAEGWLEGVTFEMLNQRFGNYYNITETV